MSVVNYVFNTGFNAVVGVPLDVLNAGLNAAQATYGVVGTALSILTRGKNQKINNWADNTGRAQFILPNLYDSVVRVVNPDASFNELKMGVITSTVVTPFFRVAGRAAVEDGFIIRHIVSRLSYAVAAVASVASRVADLALGVVAGAFSIIPCIGRSKAVNNFARNHLSAFGVVNDVCCGLRGFVNPQQFVGKRHSNQPAQIVRQHILLKEDSVSAESTTSESSVRVK